VLIRTGLLSCVAQIVRTVQYSKLSVTEICSLT
jgi:hypothetical protein